MPSILVVEDDELVRMVTIDMLSDLGWSTSEAVDGPTAITLLNADPGIEVMLTDIALGGMTGYELIREAKIIRPDLKVLVASGYHNLAHEQVDGILPKPYDMAELSAALTALNG